MIVVSIISIVVFFFALLFFFSVIFFNRYFYLFIFYLFIIFFFYIFHSRSLVLKPYVFHRKWVMQYGFSYTYTLFCQQRKDIWNKQTSIQTKF